MLLRVLQSEFLSKFKSFFASEKKGNATVSRLVLLTITLTQSFDMISLVLWRMLWSDTTVACCCLNACFDC